MKRENSGLECLLWGASIGASLGLLEAVAGVRWWMAFGQPDFLVRPHQVGLYTIGNTVAGAACGVVFGSLVGAIAKRTNAIPDFRKLYAYLLVTGVLVFVPLYYLILKAHIPLWFVGDVALFALGIVLAKRTMEPDCVQLEGVGHVSRACCPDPKPVSTGARRPLRATIEYENRAAKGLAALPHTPANDLGNTSRRATDEDAVK